ncbi:hypothetical protein ERO13_D13G149701v2 [Gossypium hirsutum]|uniref:Uncharacterized protein n=1 Tax=Gossypium darwinii TaxID=34276 RepID=A0A5D2A2R9_GOSDA|nr:hypothetical protein ERO13_D13G149701v2 [Gossypium hirsutum]TYG37945.1 hypothetical protein ES288_D13G182500v1 [Gossypium darwinii]
MAVVLSKLQPVAELFEPLVAFMSWIIEHIFYLSLKSEMHFLMTDIESLSIWILWSFSCNPSFTASKHACTFAAKVEPTFSWMVAFEAITLPLPS